MPPSPVPSSHQQAPHRAVRVSPLAGVAVIVVMVAAFGTAAPHTAALVTATPGTAALGTAAPGTAAPGPVEDFALVNANVVDVVEGTVTEGATIVVRDGKIDSIGAAPLPAGIKTLDAQGRHVLPGLIDAHVHIGGFDAARRALLSGVTTARSMGASHYVDVGLRELQARGLVESPEIVAAGYHVRPEPAEGFFLDEPGLGELLESGVRGPEALRRMARTLIARGVDFIKTNATERAGLPHTDPRKPFYTEEELRALVEEAAAADVPVAAHAHGNEGGLAAVRAGVRSIEHGTYLDEATLQEMAERGTFLVPTIAVVSDLTVPGGDYDNPVLNIRGRHMLPQVRSTARAAAAAGVRLVAATDTGYGPDSVLRLSHELLELVEHVGLSPLDALRAATTTAAELLRVDDHTGRLAPGYDADLIAVAANPLEDIGTVQDVLLIVHDGRVALDRLSFSVEAPAASAPPGPASMQAGRAPGFTLQSLDGRTYSLDGARGEGPLLLVFFRGAW